MFNMGQLQLMVGWCLTEFSSQIGHIMSWTFQKII